MITKKDIEKKLDELYPSRKSNILKEGRTNAIELLETAMAQGFMDCIKFIFEDNQKNKDLKNEK